MRLEPQLLDARRSYPDKSTPLLNLWNYAIDQGAADNFTLAFTALEKLEGAINKLALTSPAANTGANGLEQALAKWADAREQVIDSLKALEGRIRAMNDPDGDAAIILVKSIQSNLTARPDKVRTIANIAKCR